MSNVSRLLIASCTRQRLLTSKARAALATSAIIRQQQIKSPSSILLIRNLNLGFKNKRPNLLSPSSQTPPRWTQKYERILYTTVTEQYIDKGQEIDWEKVAGRVVRFDKEQCKTRFYQLQRQLTDRTSSKGSVWTRREIDRMCTGAHKAEQAALKKNSDSKGSDGSGSRHVDWTVIAKEFAPKRSPDECKRIYSDYRHLSRFNIGWRKYQSKIRTLVSAVIFLACISFYTRLVDVVYDYIEGEETIDIKVPKEQEI